MKHQVLITMLCILSYSVQATTLGTSPLCQAYTPNSILKEKHKYKPMPVGKRKRYATCSGAAWFHDDYLATVNLYGNSVHSYYFDREANKLTLIQSLTNKDGIALHYPENLTFSPDGTLLAVCNSETSKVNLYRVDLATHMIDPLPLFSLPTKSIIHNVRFSSDGHYLAYTAFDFNDALCICRVHREHNSCWLERIYSQPVIDKKFRTKGVLFTQDSCFVVVAYSLSIVASVNNKLENCVACYRFNPDGSVGERVSTVYSQHCVEDIAFVDNEHSVLATDQINDTVCCYPFNPETGELGKPHTVLKNPKAKISFPHGIGVSHDQHYLALANYGDDRVALYSLSD